MFSGHTCVCAGWDEGLVPLILRAEVRPVQKERQAVRLREAQQAPWVGVSRQLPAIDTLDAPEIPLRVRPVVPVFQQSHATLAIMRFMRATET